MNACIGCHSCEVACAEQNGLPADTAWRRVGEIEGGDLSRHPALPPLDGVQPLPRAGVPRRLPDRRLREAAPTASSQHHADDCIGCQYCTWNCPYSVPGFQPDRRIVTKCDMCQPRLEAGHDPGVRRRLPHRTRSASRRSTSPRGAPTTPRPTRRTCRRPTSRVDHAHHRCPTRPGARRSRRATTRLRPEHPHWPLVWLTLLTQRSWRVVRRQHWRGARGRSPPSLAAARALAASLFHLGRPLRLEGAAQPAPLVALARGARCSARYAGVRRGCWSLPADGGVTGPRRWRVGSRRVRQRPAVHRAGTAGVGHAAHHRRSSG